MYGQRKEVALRGSVRRPGERKERADVLLDSKGKLVDTERYREKTLRLTVREIPVQSKAFNEVGEEQMGGGLLKGKQWRDLRGH